MLISDLTGYKNTKKCRNMRARRLEFADGNQHLQSRNRPHSYPIRTPFGTGSVGLRHYGAKKERTK